MLAAAQRPSAAVTFNRDPAARRASPRVAAAPVARFFILLGILANIAWLAVLVYGAGSLLSLGFASL